MRMLIRLLELIKWLPVRSYDPMHKHRRPLGHFMHYRLVELGADIVIGLQDQLHQILTQKLTDRELAEQVMSLRYRALAFSLRDRWGRCPFDGNNPTQLDNLIALPPRLHVRLPRPDGHVHSRTDLHAQPRRRRPETGRRGRCAQRQLCPGETQIRHVTRL